ncbi:MAG: hypothetical protein RBT81_06590, partial [Gammaproteobacteria bacterium]|nr:hypothetical protein [Gammaproteobacteria bacterium]
GSGDDDGSGDGNGPGDDDGNPQSPSAQSGDGGSGAISIGALLFAALCGPVLIRRRAGPRRGAQARESRS